jgi:hypothetical protein
MIAICEEIFCFGNEVIRKIWYSFENTQCTQRGLRTGQACDEIEITSTTSTFLRM